VSHIHEDLRKYDVANNDHDNHGIMDIKQNTYKYVARFKKLKHNTLEGIVSKSTLLCGDGKAAVHCHCDCHLQSNCRCDCSLGAGW